MKLSETEESLLRDIESLLDNTHQYDSDLFYEIRTVLSNNECDNIYSLLEWCVDQLDNTHCYDTKEYQAVKDYLL